MWHKRNRERSLHIANSFLHGMAVQQQFILAAVHLYFTRTHARTHARTRAHAHTHTHTHTHTQYLIACENSLDPSLFRCQKLNLYLIAFEIQKSKKNYPLAQLWIIFLFLFSPFAFFHLFLVHSFHFHLFEDAHIPHPLCIIISSGLFSSFIS